MEVDEAGLNLDKQFYYQNYSYCLEDYENLDGLLFAMINRVKETDYLSTNDLHPYIKERWYAFLKELNLKSKVKMNSLLKLKTSEALEFSLNEKLKLKLAAIKS